MHTLRFSLFLAVLWAAAGAAWTWPSLPPAIEPQPFVAVEDQQATQSLSPAEAAKRAQAVNGGGRVLSVQPDGKGWKVKLLKDGNVRFVVVP